MWLPLQHLIHDLEATSPYALMLIVYVPIATIWKHIKSRKAAAANNPAGAPGAGQVQRGRLRRLLTDLWDAIPETWRGILMDTAQALLIILCLWAVQVLLALTVGDHYVVGGVPLATLLDFAHLAVVLHWLTECLLRFLP